MIKKEAYTIVVNDILEGKRKLFLGSYDAKNGSKEFMYGIQALLNHLAFQVSEEKYLEVTELFITNMQKSEEKSNI